MPDEPTRDALRHVRLWDADVFWILLFDSISLAILLCVWFVTDTFLVAALSIAACNALIAFALLIRRIHLLRGVHDKE